MKRSQELKLTPLNPSVTDATGWVCRYRNDVKKKFTVGSQFSEIQGIS